ncbi:sensor histidine kinase [Actinoplanes sp. NEAU-A12]|uniref:Sensor histidine kinase n=1 Tax=Actinoplanes sandaracinus TaxID=3045177 RepID=A0ABT6WI31_9ACTN|nr:sensor histidine kinase [Actinoplanes sandaracinus]MDI6099379.1 sensor histidine kinase [Actinoplanes sandaracinus]
MTSQTTVAEQVFDTLRALLTEQGSELIAHPEVAEQLAIQVRAVFDDVTAEITGGVPPGRAPLDVGTDRARRGIHPAESLRASTALFDVMLPALTDLLAADGHDPLRISRVLHKAIMTRVAQASLSYVNFLMEKLQASREEERLRISRELHDRVLHEMGLAVHRLDLYRFYADRDPAQARAKVDAGIECVDEAARSVRLLSAELRRSARTEGLERMLRNYLAVNAPPSVQVDVSTSGDLSLLPPDAPEELYLIVREAARNALRHASPTRLEIRIDVSQAEAHAVVSDDGCGFDPGDPEIAHGGLPSMHERAQLLRGSLRLTSSPGAGTRVEVRLPFARVTL